MRLTISLLALLSISVISSADLRADFRDFKNLIPRNRIRFIAGRHLLLDEKFRSAYNYLRSADFEALVRDEIESNQEVQDIIDYLGRDIDLNRIPGAFRKFNIPIRPAQEYGRLRTLSSFTREVAEILPNEKIKKLVREKNVSNPEFAMMYERVTNPQFKKLVSKARNSESLAGVVKVLRNNKVDVDKILEIAFQLIDKWTI